MNGFVRLIGIERIYKSGEPRMVAFAIQQNVHLDIEVLRNLVSVKLLQIFQN